MRDVSFDYKLINSLMYFSLHKADPKKINILRVNLQNDEFKQKKCSVSIVLISAAALSRNLEFTLFLHCAIRGRGLKGRPSLAE